MFAKYVIVVRAELQGVTNLRQKIRQFVFTYIVLKLENFNVLSMETFIFCRYCLSKPIHLHFNH